MNILKQGAQKLTRLFRARKKRSERMKDRPVKVKTYRPSLESLEDRTMLSATPALLGTDLTTYFHDLLDSQSASFTQTETIANASVGGFLQLSNLTLTETANLSSGGVWSGTIGLSATLATLFPGSSFGASITSTAPNTDALTGTFTIGATGSDFALTAANLVMHVGEALTITASNIGITYSSTGADDQTLATIQTATVPPT